MLRTGKINLTHIANDQLVKITLNFSKCKKNSEVFPLSRDNLEAYLNTKRNRHKRQTKVFLPTKMTCYLRK